MNHFRPIKEFLWPVTTIAPTWKQCWWWRFRSGLYKPKSSVWPLEQPERNAGKSGWKFWRWSGTAFLLDRHPVPPPPCDPYCFFTGVFGRRVGYGESRYDVFMRLVGRPLTRYVSATLVGRTHRAWILERDM